MSFARPCVTGVYCLSAYPFMEFVIYVAYTSGHGDAVGYPMKCVSDVREAGNTAKGSC